MTINQVLVERNGITHLIDVSTYQIISLNKLVEHLTTYFGDSNFNTYPIDQRP